MFNFIGQIIAFLLAITIHEAAHAWVSDRLGDPTAKLDKRISLNPIRHLDPYGTVLIPLFLIFFRSPIIFGWAKPVYTDPYNLKNPRRDTAIISLAGPAANLISAVLISIIIRFTNNPFSLAFLLNSLLYPLVTINLVLALFNLIPIHPLDGGKILVGILPQKDAYEADKFLKRYGVLILFFLIFPIFGGASPIGALLGPILNFILNILLPYPNFI
jgi:Zn-dependent protease